MHLSLLSDIGDGVITAINTASWQRLKTVYIFHKDLSVNK